MECCVDNTGRNSLSDQCAQGRFAGATRELHPVTVADATLLGIVGVDFKPILIVPQYISGAAGLRSNIVLAKDSAGGKQQRKARAGLFVSGNIFGDDKLALAAHKAAHVHDRRTFRRLLVAWPLHRPEFVEFFVGNARKGWRQVRDLVHDLGRVVVVHIEAHRFRERQRDFPVCEAIAGVSYQKLDEFGSVQWPCNEKAPEGTPVMHMNGFVRGKGKFVITEYVPTDEKTGPRFPLLLTTGRILSQYNVGAQTRRTANVVWHDEDRLEIHPHDAEQRGIRDGDWVKLASRAGETSLRALITERVAPGVVYTTFHHPNTQANVVTTEFSDWATNCPEYKVTAVQVSPSNGPSEWQREYEEFSRIGRRMVANIEAAE